jgi:hypothetical protein
MDKWQRIAKLEAENARLNKIYDKRFKETGGLLHRTALVERNNTLKAERDRLHVAIDEMMNCTSKDAEGLVKAVGVLAVKSGYFDRKAALEAE